MFSFLSSCSPIYLLPLLPHSVFSHPFSNSSTHCRVHENALMKTCHLLLVGQKTPGCSSGQLPHNRQFCEVHDKWPHVWKSCEEGSERLHQTDLLDGKRDFKDLRRVHHKTQASPPSAPNLIWQLAFITGELQHRNERPRWELLTCFCQGRSLNHHITASGNHSQILFSKCFLCQRTSLLNNWNANKPPPIFKMKKKWEGWR